MDPFDSYFIRKLSKKNSQTPRQISQDRKTNQLEHVPPHHPTHVHQPNPTRRQTQHGPRVHEDPPCPPGMVWPQQPRIRETGPQPHRLHALPRRHRESTLSLDSVDAQGTLD
jgi:hypothetical protein